MFSDSTKGPLGLSVDDLLATTRRVDTREATARLINVGVSRFSGPRRRRIESTSNHEEHGCYLLSASNRAFACLRSYMNFWTELRSQANSRRHFALEESDKFASDEPINSKRLKRDGTDFWQSVRRIVQLTILVRRS